MGSFLDTLRQKNNNAISGQKRLANLEEGVKRASQSRSSKKTATVFVLTYCRNVELFYGTELIFKCLRTGFPNANVVVIDNASLPEVKPEIEALAKDNDCHYEEIPAPGVVHHQFIQNVISAMAEDESGDAPLIFLDPDIYLWNNCEDFEFDGLIAGRLVGGIGDEITQSYTMPRLHTSFMWIPSARKLQDAIWKLKARHHDFEPFQSYTSLIGEMWYRYDTGAGLYAALGGKVSIFKKKHLDRYGHLYGGSHLDIILGIYDLKTKKMMLEIHKHAKDGNMQALKESLQYFNNSFHTEKQDSKV